jgi:Fe-S-cluster formation regulator IscX/YfhJ
MMSSGPASFWSIFKSFHDFCQSPSIANLLTCLGHINHTMRRGGYKKGIVTSAMDYECPLIEEYLDIDITELQGSHKLGVIVDPDILRFHELVDKIVEKRNSQSLFLEKRASSTAYFNVCQGIELGHRGTCLIWRVNLGLCVTDDDIISAFAAAISKLVNLHISWRNSPSNPGIYAPLNDDRQVALDVMGLANILSIRDIKYSDFIVSLEAFNDDPIASSQYTDPKIYKLISAIDRGYKKAIEIADGIIADCGDLLPLDRLFTVEPAQSHSYETKDSQGFTTCRGIFPPFGRVVTRNSESEVERTYNHGNVETAGEIGADWQIRLCNAWQRLMDSTGHAHAISQDTYKEMDKDGFIKWLDSPSKTLYYAEHRNYNQRKHLAKTIAVCQLDNRDECTVCAE